MRSKKQKEFGMTRAQVLERLKGIPTAAKGRVVCALVGHSRIVSQCFGFVHCERCEAQIADKQGGAGFLGASECVQVGHNCPTCRKNYRTMDWHDKLLVKNPFTKKRERSL